MPAPIWKVGRDGKDVGESRHRVVAIRYAQDLGGRVDVVRCYHRQKGRDVVAFERLDVAFLNGRQIHAKRVGLDRGSQSDLFDFVEGASHG
jgi:hypothetical protein